jgi:hypothetical protein
VPPPAAGPRGFPADAIPELIGAPGFEPGTSPTRTARATRLRHAPKTVEFSYRVPETVVRGVRVSDRYRSPATALK